MKVVLDHLDLWWRKKSYLKRIGNRLGKSTSAVRSVPPWNVYFDIPRPTAAPNVFHFPLQIPGPDALANTSGWICTTAPHQRCAPGVIWSFWKPSESRNVRKIIMFEGEPRFVLLKNLFFFKIWDYTTRVGPRQIVEGGAQCFLYKMDGPGNWYLCPFCTIFDYCTASWLIKFGVFVYFAYCTASCLIKFGAFDNFCPVYRWSSDYVYFTICFIYLPKSLPSSSYFVRRLVKSRHLMVPEHQLDHLSAFLATWQWKYWLWRHQRPWLFVPHILIRAGKKNVYQPRVPSIGLLLSYFSTCSICWIDVAVGNPSESSFGVEVLGDITELYRIHLGCDQNIEKKIK